MRFDRAPQPGSIEQGMPKVRLGKARRTITRPAAVAAAFAATAFLFSGPAYGQSPARADCVRLATISVPPRSIGLPTGGVSINSAVPVVGTGAAGSGTGRYCLVSGEIAPVDPLAGKIRFSVALPDEWNGKAVMLGGAGFNGVVPDVAGNVLNAPPGAGTPLARGYAVFGSDSGHVLTWQGSSFVPANNDGAFFGRAETYRNYIGDALKKTRDVAVQIIVGAYGRAPARSYFLGSSKGGGEALHVTGRWPKDWDGVVALYPARSFTTTMLGMTVINQALAEPGAWINTAERGHLYRAALAACDDLDGAKDGIISNVRRCNASFDPASARLDGVPLRCPKGADTGDNCLSDVQLQALRKIGGVTRFDVVPGRDDYNFPGFNVVTSGLGASSASPLEPVVAGLTIGLTKPAFPTIAGNALGVHFADNFARFAIARDPGFSQFDLGFADAGPHAARLQELHAIDQVDTDLSGFADRNGKLLIMHGTDDMLISPRATEQWYRQLRQTMGGRRVDSFLRYYEVPGFGHALTTIFGASWDQLSALEIWVEQGRDPARGQVVSDATGISGRTRPLCLYPTWPKYRGLGDLNNASSFVCALR